MSDITLRAARKRPLFQGLHRAAIVFTVCAAFFAAYFHRMGLAVITPELEAAFNLSAVTLGLLGAAYFYPYSFIQIPVGILVDAFGSRLVLSVFVSIAALGSILFGSSTSLELALIGRLMVGLGVASVYLSAQQLFVNWFHPRQFATLTGVINAAGNLGGISASLPLVAMVAAFGWREVFVGAGVLMFGIALLSALIIRNRPSSSETATPMDHASSRKGAWRTVREGIGAVTSKGQIWPLAIGVLPFVGTRFGFQSLWGGPYLSDVYHLSSDEIGTLMMLMSLSVVLFSPAAGFMSDRVFSSRKWFAVGGMAIYSVLWLPLVFATGMIPVFAFYPLVVGLGVLSCMWIPVYAQAKELHSLAVAGTVLAVLQFATTLGGAVYQQLLGVVISFFQKTPVGYPVDAYSAAFGVCLASSVFATIMIASSRESH